MLVEKIVAIYKKSFFFLKTNISRATSYVKGLLLWKDEKRFVKGFSFEKKV